MLRDRISALLEEKKISKSELARKIGVRAYRVTDWTTGRSEPNVEMLAKIAAALGVTVAELVEEQPADSGRKKNSKVSLSGVDKESSLPENEQAGIMKLSGGIVRVRVIKRLPAGVSLDEAEYGERLVEIPASLVQGLKIAALEIENDDMAPRLEKGDTVIVGQDVEYGTRSMVLARRIDKDGCFVARFSQSNNQVTLGFDKPGKKPISFGLLDPDQKLRILGKVVVIVPKE